MDSKMRIDEGLYERRGAENAERRGGMQMHENEISERIIGAAIEVHRILGPGLLEPVYEESLCHEFHLREISRSQVALGNGRVQEVVLQGETQFPKQARSQVQLGNERKGVKLATDLRLDLLVEDKVIVDLKAKEQMTDKDHAKTLIYLRLSNKRLGLNINFHEPTLVKGIKRIVNDLE